MSKATQTQMTRREWMGRSAGALLALGLWPGCARWAGKRSAGDFSFAVINDAHFQSPKCPAWFERVFADIRAQESRPELCLVVGDLTEHASRSEFGQMRELLRGSGLPYYAVPGNHDYLSKTNRSTWEEAFPASLNYHFEHRGWQFIALDSCDGREYKNTQIQPETFAWLDANLPKLDPAKPTILFTHFPLGILVPMRPANAEALLERFRDFNLIGVFNGHFHGYTTRRVGRIELTTNRCCAISRNNHDGTPEKGYFLCTAKAGEVRREFVEVQPV